jgi:hypothetical protein
MLLGSRLLQQIRNAGALSQALAASQDLDIGVYICCYHHRTLCDYATRNTSYFRIYGMEYKAAWVDIREVT